ncbi:TIM barrel protein [Metallosphaera sedula]|uniref:TIM barrel protein n=1 Tax=Metallosphaera sedula TaxID=43687 RepID=UPI0020BFF5EB|nr:TIM barrel protein [Metallosphaera sedula]
MVKIFLGPAGIPLSTRGKGSIEGVKRVKELGLNAMEVEFVQGVKMSVDTAKELGSVAQELGVRLSVHAPYFINLCSSDQEKVKASQKRIFDTAERASAMGADAIAIHVGFYGDYTPEQCYSLVKDSLLAVRDKMKENSIDSVKLGVETMAKETAFGTLDEVISISKEVPGVIPYIDWAHTFARQGGNIDYDEILDRLTRELGLTHINSHFESLQVRKGKYVDVHEPISKNSPPFEPLAKALLKRDISITLICESPKLEEDALIMKGVLESLGYKLG